MDVSSKTSHELKDLSSEAGGSDFSSNEIDDNVTKKVKNDCIPVTTVSITNVESPVSVSQPPIMFTSNSLSISSSVTTSNNLGTSRLLSSRSPIKILPKYRTLCKTPLIKSPVKSGLFSYRSSNRRRKPKVLSPRKIKFILPKVCIYFDFIFQRNL